MVGNTETIIAVWNAPDSEGLTQVVMHSKNHRGQWLTKIREDGGKPPTLDYIKWAQNQHPDRSHSTPPNPAA
jgi:uncharacterized damage-inducible protein DinB